MRYYWLLIAVMGFCFAVPTNAEPYRFTITGDYNAVFYADSSPSADNPLEGALFALYDVPGFPDAVDGIADITFFNLDQGGGLQIHDFYGDSYLLVADGSQLYLGSESTPTFLTGDFSLTQYEGTGTYSINIAAVNSAVPEPASWALLLGGVGMIGYSMRARRMAKVSFG